MENVEVENCEVENCQGRGEGKEKEGPKKTERMYRRERMMTWTKSGDANASQFVQNSVTNSR